MSGALEDFFAIWGAGSSPRDRAAHAVIPSQSTLLADFESLSKMMSGATPGKEQQPVPASVGTQGLAEFPKEAFPARASRAVAEQGCSTICCSPAPHRQLRNPSLLRVTNPAGPGQKMHLSSLLGARQGSGSSDFPRLKGSLRPCGQYCR